LEMNMRNLWLGLMVVTLASAGDIGPGTVPSECFPGGFTLIEFPNGVQIQPKPDANFNVHFDADDYQGNAFDTALRTAMSNWSTVSGSGWRYNFADYTLLPPSSSDGQMTIVRGGMLLAPGVLAATLVSAFANGQLVDADIYFNPSVPWGTDGGAGAFDFQSVALHEQGHGLGLDHNDACTASPTVMESVIGLGVLRRTLQGPEQEGVRYLYPGAGPELIPTPSSLAFSGVAGGAPPFPQTVVLTGTPGLFWTASSNVNWMIVLPAAGTVPGVLTVVVVPFGMPAGTHLGRITIIAGTITREIPVTLTLSPGSGFEVSPTTLDFTAQAGGLPPAPQTVTLTGTGGLGWSASVTAAGGNWLQVAPAAGTVPGSAAVSVVPTGLSPNVYTGQITFLGGGVSRVVTVRLTVVFLPVLEVTPAELSLTAVAGSATPSCGSVQVSAGGAAVFFGAAALSPWLTVNPASGVLPATLTVCATALYLPAGQYLGSLFIVAPASNSPFLLPVRFTVTPGG
jgi:hypothetical protein